jgi:hypothetical protein
MKLTKLILSMLLVVNGATFASPQEPSSPAIQMEASVREKQPTWRQVNRTVSKDGRYVSYRWKLRTSSVELLLVFNASTELAIDRFNTLPVDLELSGLAMNESKTDLRLADQVLSWSHRYDRRTVGILFRKGRVVANVSGTRRDDVERFASQIADSLPPA